MIQSTYSVVPTSRLEALSQLPNVLEPGHFDVLYEPSIGEDVCIADQKCKRCEARIFDKCATTETQWVCAFCNTYNDLSEKPISVSYTSSMEGNTGISPVLVVVDLNCDDSSELKALHSVLSQSLHQLSATEFGLITIIGNGDVTIHLTSGPMTFSSDDSTIVTKAQKLDWEHFEKKLPDKSVLWQSAENLVGILGTLNSVKRSSGQRHIRATGLALFLAALYANSGTHLPVISFLQGPCTIGPGKVVPKKLKHHIRQHYDLDSNKDKYFKPAKSFYEALAKRIYMHTFISSLDQVGVVEMMPLCSSAIQFDSYGEDRFATAFRSQAQDIVQVSKVTVNVSKGILVDGCFGKVTKLSATQQIYSDTPCGVSGTNCWALNTSKPSLSFSLRVDTAATKASSIDTIPGHLAIQFQYEYQKGKERYVKVDTLIVATTNHEMSTPTSIQDSFNAHVGLVCLMKQIAFEQAAKGRIHSFDQETWRYKVDALAASHYKLKSKGLNEFLEYLFRLKWTALLQKRNTSPDEAALFQLLVLVGTASLCELLCKPHVLIFANGQKLQVTNLDEHLLHVREAICVDGGNFVVVRYTSVSENADIATSYANSIVNTRCPPPIFKKTPVGGSQDRFFVSSLIPQGGLNTEDISLQDYLDLIRKMSLDV
ncbi:LAFE_0F12596g1_1 [Lachancea fermentati]|uniref:Protein transport protein SEC23 n=1 Tax=Lachancea fermentati TaxID=4955 RepID=A0A1G4MG23_LACFM|nr:LAFE_0F12596g1_1 [Lachancea fermentati]